MRGATVVRLEDENRLPFEFFCILDDGYDQGLEMAVRWLPYEQFIFQSAAHSDSGEFLET